MIKKIAAILLFLLLTVPVYGSECEGSIRLVMRSGGEPLSGGSVTLYPLEDIPVSGDGAFLAEYVQDNGFPGIICSISADGVAEFSGLEPGYYLAVQQEAAAGYYPMVPFCVSLPMQTDGKLVWDIVAHPKLEKLPDANLPQTGQRVWPVWVLMCGGVALMGFGMLQLKNEK